jgi:HEAT repeat protein
MSDSEYVFRPEDLQSADENLRRFAIIHISKERLTDFENHLVEMMATEQSYANRRHIVRALGKIGTARSIGLLLGILSEPDGLILGDAAQALGRLRVPDAVGRLQELTASRVEWIAGQARWALSQTPR